MQLNLDTRASQQFRRANRKQFLSPASHHSDSVQIFEQLTSFEKHCQWYLLCLAPASEFGVRRCQEKYQKEYCLKIDHDGRAWGEEKKSLFQFRNASIRWNFGRIKRTVYRFGSSFWGCWSARARHTNAPKNGALRIQKLLSPDKWVGKLDMHSGCIGSVPLFWRKTTQPPPICQPSFVSR